MSRYFSDKRIVGILSGIVRVWLGWSFLQAGWEKLTDAKGAWIGSTAGSAIKGFLGNTVKGATGAHPTVHPWFASLTQNFFLPNATLFSYMVAFGETLVGIALIIGLFTRFAAFWGGFLNLMFLFGGSTSTNTEMLVAEVAIVFGGLYASYYGLDTFVLPYLKKVLHIGEVKTPIEQPVTSNPQLAATGIR